MCQCGVNVVVLANLFTLIVGAAPEEIAAQTIDTLFGNVMTRISGGSDTGADAAMDYTYHDPATNTYTTDYTQASQPLVAPEEGETVSTMADDMLAIETSMTNITALDTTVVMDGINEDLATTNTAISEATEGLGALVAADYSIEMPIRFVFEAQTAEMLSRNPTVLETFRLVLPQVGVTPE